MALQMGQNNALFQNSFSRWHQIISAPYCFTIYLAVCSQCCWEVNRAFARAQQLPTLINDHLLSPISFPWPINIPALLNSLQIADQKRDDGTGNGGRKEEALHPGCVNDPGDSNHSGWQTLLGWRCKRGSRVSRHERFLTGYRETFTVHHIYRSSSRTINHPDTHKH